MFSNGQIKKHVAKLKSKSENHPMQQKDEDKKII